MTDNIYLRWAFALDSRIAHRRLADRATGDLKALHTAQAVRYREQALTLEAVARLRKAEIEERISDETIAELGVRWNE